MTSRRALALACAFLALASAGCIQNDRTPQPARLELSATWQDAQHLNVVAHNAGDQPLPLAGLSMHLVGPNGTMPVHWSGMAPTLAEGERRHFELHAMHMSDGTTGLTMDHAMAGEHMPMLPGEYMLRMGDASAMTRLAD